MRSSDFNRPLRVETEELKGCPNCHDRRAEVWCQGHDRLHGLSQQKFTYSRCKRCGLLFLSRRPLESEIHKFYPKDYAPYQAEGQAKAPQEDERLAQKQGRGTLARRTLARALYSLNYRVGQAFPDRFPKWLESLYSPAKDGGRLLDFGCGSDRFLNWARAQGWDTVGLDFSEETINQVRASGHQAHLMSPSVWDKMEDESFDFVRMNHVLEHLYEPEEILAAIKQKMKSGARLHVALPNPRGLTARIFRSRWRGLDCPRHVTLYSPSALKNLLSRLGFSDAEVMYESVTKDFVGSLGYSMYDRGRIPHDGVAKMINRQDLASLLYVPARIAAVLKLADIFHVVAKK